MRFWGFLSCLFGSERCSFGNVLDVDFLSCLFGSEPSVRVTVNLGTFLSCLFGSELRLDMTAGSLLVSKLPIRQ